MRLFKAKKTKDSARDMVEKAGGPKKSGKDSYVVGKVPSVWGFPSMMVPQNGWFMMENLIKMDDLGGKPTIFGNTRIGIGTWQVHWNSTSMTPWCPRLQRNTWTMLEVLISHHQYKNNLEGQKTTNIWGIGKMKRPESGLSLEASLLVFRLRFAKLLIILSIIVVQSP